MDISILYAYGTRTGARSALMSDLGGGGMRLETDEDMPPGTEVTVRFSLPHASHVLTAAGHVVLSFWNPLHSRLAHGVAFSAIDEADQELIVKFIHEVQVEELRKRRKIED